MANNWYFELQSLAKTNDEAKKHLQALKSATTEEEKATAKELAQAFVNAQAEPEKPQEPIDVSKKDIPEFNTVKPEVKEAPKTIDPTNIQEKPIIKAKPVKKVELEPADMTLPAYNPNLAKMGINREEELFKKGIMIRKMTLQEKIAMRESIYQKTHKYNSAIQEKFRQEQLARIEKDAHDPEKIKWNNQRRLFNRILDELAQNHNIYYMFKEIDGLNPDVMRELLQNPANVAEFDQRNPEFVKGFYQLYGE